MLEKILSVLFSLLKSSTKPPTKSDDHAPIPNDPAPTPTPVPIPIPNAPSPTPKPAPIPNDQAPTPKPVPIPNAQAPTPKPAPIPQAHVPNPTPFPTVAIISGLKNLDKLKGHVPDSVLLQIDTLGKFNLNTNLRLAHFLAQAAHESNNFTAVYENLNYSAKALMGVFPKYFPDEKSANLYARQPEKIGSKIYANRMGNGDEASKEGFLFRGRGFLQTTGRSNYENFSKFIEEDCVKNPDLIAIKYPLASAAFFFNSNNIWVICDKGSDDATLTSVSKKINGGTIGLPDRIEKFKFFNKLLS